MSRTVSQALAQALLSRDIGTDWKPTLSHTQAHMHTCLHARTHTYTYTLPLCTLSQNDFYDKSLDLNCPHAEIVRSDLYQKCPQSTFAELFLSSDLVRSTKYLFNVHKKSTLPLNVALNGSCFLTGKNRVRVDNGLTTLPC